MSDDYTPSTPRRPRPAVGQVWKDIDPRGGRTFVIVGIADGKAECRHPDGEGRLSRIRLDRFRATARTGYVFLHDAGDER